MNPEDDPKAERPINYYYGMDLEPTDPMPVEGGIRPRSQAGRFTTSWWAGRWVHALTRLVDAARLARGRAYARRGQVTSLEVQVGLVLAQVQGTQSTPYRVRIEVKTLEDAEWGRAVEAMSSQALYAAQLLNGDMPHEIEDVFRSAGVSLFPESRSELVTHCTCPDWASPCKHVAAVCMLLGESLDQDPFLLFVMRGRTREQIMSELRAARASRASEPATQQAGMADALQRERLLTERLDDYWRMGPEAQNVQIHVAPAAVEMEVLKVLGDPLFAEDESLVQRLTEVYRTVSGRAVDVAFEEHEPPAADKSGAAAEEPNGD
ncbi:MAG: SWIM zinc finger family protein [Anaerolineae bacterium]